MLRYFLMIAVVVQVGGSLPLPLRLFEGTKNPYPYIGMMAEALLYVADLVWPGEKIMFATEPEANMTVPEMIEYHGYPSEVHTVQTTDGYILDIHRIPHGVNSVGSEPRQPVLLVHNVGQSSGEWVMDFPHKSLGYVLADAGFDVWMGNARGNVYSRKHASISPEDNQFWKFSLDEMSEMDLPAMIDYITEKTGQVKVHCLGHGIGATTLFGMLASKPEYNDKVRSFVSLSPFMELNHATSPLTYLKPFVDLYEEVMNRIGFLEVYPLGIAEPVAGPGRIHHPLAVIPLIKTAMVVGYGVSINTRFNETRLPFYLHLIPAGTSNDVVVHLGQILTSGGFRKFDHGVYENDHKYGSPSPPLFELEQVNAPTILCVSDSDPVVSLKDVQHFSSRLTNIHKTIAVSGFDHMDFIWAPDAKQTLWDDVIREMKKL